MTSLNQLQDNKYSNRPKSITVIALLIISINIFGAFLVIKDAVSSEPQSATLSAVGMLKGKNWARLLFVIGWPIAFFVGHFVYSKVHAPTQIYAVWMGGFIFLAIFLFTGKSHDYFADKTVPSDWL